MVYVYALDSLVILAGLIIGHEDEDTLLVVVVLGFFNTMSTLGSCFIYKERPRVRTVNVSATLGDLITDVGKNFNLIIFWEFGNSIA